jgi:hypothetical protein
VAGKGSGLAGGSPSGQRPQAGPTQPWSVKPTAQCPAHSPADCLKQKPLPSGQHAWDRQRGSVRPACRSPANSSRPMPSSDISSAPQRKRSTKLSESHTGMVRGRDKYLNCLGILLGTDVLINGMSEHLTLY